MQYRLVNAVANAKDVTAAESITALPQSLALSHTVFFKVKNKIKIKLKKKIKNINRS